MDFFHPVTCQLSSQSQCFRFFLSSDMRPCKSMDCGLAIIIFIIISLFIILFSLLFFVKYEWCPVLFRNNTESTKCNYLIRVTQFSLVLLDQPCWNFTFLNYLILISVVLTTGITKLWNYIILVFIDHR
jgi:hypothetical protein